ncbi:MAG: alanine/glycine:cation symporter family protein [Alphaproteobacteria bacterium]
MEQIITNIFSPINSVVWGWPTLILLLGTGLFLTVGLAFMPIRKIGYAFGLLFKGQKADGDGDISPFNALMTSLSATVGTGNIVGVAGAIAIGGPGALFWMWMTALLGMATKYAEAVLAVKYRETDGHGRYVGGPMYYIKNGFAEIGWAKPLIFLGWAFAIFGAFAGFGIGNGTQINSIASNLQSTFGIDPRWTGGVVMLVVGVVLIGGIKWIAQVAGKLVPFMALFYIAAALIILFFNLAAIPSAIATIVTEAFTGTAATGGFAGSVFILAMRMGVARGVFSNEAGLGSAPIAHASAQTNDPVKQGNIAMLGTFIDTIVICTLTGLVIVTSGVWSAIDPETGKQLSKAAISATAFAQTLPSVGAQLVTVGLVLFAFTTILGWSHYAERCVEFLFGDNNIVLYGFRIIWCIAIYFGAISTFDTVWLIADTLNGLMAIPNLIALLILSPVVFGLTKKYFAK